MTAIVFTGPTLSADAARAALACTVLPPARQGDVWRAVRDHAPTAIGLIDGVFLHAPAVWHREILWALSQGVHVFGAASMGALRAAELADFGMRGVGQVYAAYRDGFWPDFADPFEDDDEVAVIHAPAELGGGALSDAMVDLRDTLRAAEAAGLLDRAERDALAQELKRLAFPERRFSVLATLAGEMLPPGRAAALATWLPDGAVRRKQRDAVALLREMAAFLAPAPPPFAATFRFEHAQVWQEFLDAEAAATTPEEALVLEELRLAPAEWRQAAQAALGRMQQFATATPGDERQAWSAIRSTRGLSRRADIDAWLAANALDRAGLARLVGQQAALAAACDNPPPGLDAAMADALRLAGRFAPLLQQARARHAATAGLAVPGAGPELDAALSWHAERHGADPPPPWPGTAQFDSAVWRAYVHAHRGSP